eukprot:COSAG02_NODE_13257_length_1419_cov_6.937121_1_plen_172_part_00
MVRHGGASPTPSGERLSWAGHSSNFDRSQTQSCVSWLVPACACARTLIDRWQSARRPRAARLLAPSITRVGWTPFVAVSALISGNRHKRRQAAPVAPIGAGRWRQSPERDGIRVIMYDISLFDETDYKDDEPGVQVQIRIVDAWPVPGDFRPFFESTPVGLSRVDRAELNS